MSEIKVNKISPATGTDITLGDSGDTFTVDGTELKVNKISPASGTAFTLGDSGDTFTVPSGGTIVNSGTATGFGGGSWTLIKTLTASADATLSFVDGSASVVMDNTYRSYKWVFLNMHPSNDNAHFGFQCSSNAGVGYGINIKTVQGRNYHSGSSEYWSIGSRSSNTPGTGSGGTQFENIAHECGSDNEQSMCGWLELYAPSGTTHHKKVISWTLKEQANNMLDGQFMHGLFHDASALDAIQFKFDAGNIDTGQISMFGMA
jgi:hypothetical protein